jgi:hypothetical protein
MQLIDPLTYPSWNDCLLATSSASIFHTTNWLRALQESYGYRPYYFGRFYEKQLTVLLPFMEVRSWITGVRGVSIPFADYCEPIIAVETVLSELLAPVSITAQQRQWKFFEVRGGDTLFPGVSPYTSYTRHSLALDRHEEEIFARLRSNYRAKIKKACRHGLTATHRCSPEAMAEYYRLHCLTRKRHGLPPQPAYFFKKIQEHIIAQHFGFVMLVSYQGRNIAGAIFFTFGSQAIYKFGALDIKYQHLHPNYLLFWSVIQWLCDNNYKEICFGRTSQSQNGLIQFKDGWDTRKSQINYYKYDTKAMSFVQNANRQGKVGYDIYKKIPMPLLQLAGSMFYKHVG